MEPVEETLPRDAMIDGKYRVLRPIGVGGMGTVYEAVQVAIDRKVAVKVLHSYHRRNSEAYNRFLQEARLAASIGHDNICEVTDLGTLEDGIPYLVMPVLKGIPLSELIEQSDRPLDIDMICDVVCQTLSALHAAHIAGIIHRDMKPENIFITTFGDREGFVKLLDFGISKVMESHTVPRFTRTGTVVGTPYYMSPEQAKGAKDIDHRLDIYATGVIFYEALTGELPFDGETYNEIMFNIVSQDFKAPRELRPEIPLALEQIILKAMAKEPSDRYGTALEMREECKSTMGIMRNSRDMILSSSDIPSSAMGNTPPSNRLWSSSYPAYTPSPQPKQVPSRFGSSSVPATTPSDALFQERTRRSFDSSSVPTASPVSPSPSAPQPLNRKPSQTSGDRLSPIPELRASQTGRRAALVGGDPEKPFRLVAPVPKTFFTIKMLGTIAGVLLGSFLLGGIIAVILSDSDKESTSPPGRTAAGSPEDLPATEPEEKPSSRADYDTSVSSQKDGVASKNAAEAERTDAEEDPIGKYPWPRHKKRPPKKASRKSKAKPAASQPAHPSKVKIIRVKDAIGKSYLIVEDN